jgi:hypothetical protein
VPDETVKEPLEFNVGFCIVLRVKAFVVFV